jgi:hypothetical protein
MTNSGDPFDSLNNSFFDGPKVAGHLNSLRALDEQLGKPVTWPTDQKQKETLQTQLQDSARNVDQLLIESTADLIWIQQQAASAAGDVNLNDPGSLFPLMSSEADLARSRIIAAGGLAATTSVAQNASDQIAKDDRPAVDSYRADVGAAKDGAQLTWKGRQSYALAALMCGVLLQQRDMISAGASCCSFYD